MASPLKLHLFFQALMLSVLFTYLVPSQTVPSLQGWRQSKWGMNEQQVLKAFKGEVVYLKEATQFRDGEAPIGIESYTLASHQYKVSFIFNQGKLHRVALDLHDEGSESVFESLEKLLIEKYGKAIHQKNKRDDGRLAESLTREAIWSFPKTTITLTYYELNGASTSEAMRVVLLSYKSRSRELDKL